MKTPELDFVNDRVAIEALIDEIGRPDPSPIRMFQVSKPGTLIEFCLSKLMRVLLYIALATALWYLSKAFMRHYLSTNSGTKNDAGHRSTQQTDPSNPTQEIPYESVRDARYRDVE